jgi:hypothetical protein
MKKLLLLIAVMLIAVPCSAEGIDLSTIGDKFPLKQGVAFSLEDSCWNYLSTIELASWKGITLEAGYAGAEENTKHKAVAVVSYPILKLKDYVNLPVLDLVELNAGFYVGYGRLNLLNDESKGEFDYGPSLTLINIKF